MLNFFISFYKKNLSFSFIFYYLERFYMFYNEFSLKICYLMSLKYLQMINYFLFILVKFVKFYKFNNIFNNFNSKFTSYNIIC